MKTSKVKPSAKAPGPSYLNRTMEMKRHILIAIFLFLALTSNGQEQRVTIAFDCQEETPTLTLVEGKGALFYFPEDVEKYRGKYYLHTDAHVINIDPSSKLDKDFNRMAFRANDQNSEWLAGSKPLGNNALIGQSMLSNKEAPLSFKWGKRAYVFISVNEKKKTDKNSTLFLIVLPTPPEDTLISKIDKPVFNVVDDTICGILTIRRTGRCIIDSVYVEGKKAPTTYNTKNEPKDKAYYNNDPYALVEIRCPWNRKSKDLNVVVFMTRFNDDSTMTPCQEELIVEPFEKSFFAWYWWLIGIIVLALMVFLSILIFKRSKRGPTPSRYDDIPTQRQFMKLKKENEKLYTELEREKTRSEEICKEMKVEAEKRLHAMEKHYHEELENLQTEIERLKIPTQAAIDEAMFISKCNDLLEEIQNIRTTTKGKPELAELDKQLRELEKIVIIQKP